MNTISSDEIIQNIKKINDKYQEILLLLMQGKGAFVPNSLIDNEKAKEMISKSFEHLINFGVNKKSLYILLREEIKDLGILHGKKIFILILLSNFT